MKREGGSQPQTTGQPAVAVAPQISVLAKTGGSGQPQSREANRKLLKACGGVRRCREFWHVSRRRTPLDKLRKDRRHQERREAHGWQKKALGGGHKKLQGLLQIWSGGGERLCVRACPEREKKLSFKGRKSDRKDDLEERRMDY